MALLESPGGVVLQGPEVWLGAALTAGVGTGLGAGLGLLARSAVLGSSASVWVVLMLCAAPQTGTVLVHAPPGWGAGCVGLGLLVAGLARRWPHRAWAGLVIAMALAAVGTQAALPGGGEPPGPPLLVVTLDTTRADVLAPWNPAAAGRAPVLESLAAEATVYSSAHAPVALTGPAHAALFSGGDTVLQAVPRNGLAVPPGGPWLWTALQGAGWDTSGVVSAAVLDAQLGFCRGLRRCDTAFSDRLRRGHPLLRGLGWRSRAGIAVQRPDAQTVSLAAKLWESSHGSPALWVHLYGPHWPYSPSAKARLAEGVAPGAVLPDRGLPGLGAGSWNSDEVALGASLYRAQFRDLDEALAELLALVGPEAAVVVVGDHGEGLGEHGDAFQHGRQPFAPTSWVPLVMRCPGMPAQTVSEPVSTASLWSLLAPCLGLPAPSAAPVRTRTWASSDSGGVLGPLAGAAVRSRGWTVAASREQPLAAFESAVDPHEQIPLPVAAAPAALQAAWSDAVSDSRAHPADPVLPLEALEALGYTEGLTGSAQ